MKNPKYEIGWIIRFKECPNKSFVITERYWKPKDKYWYYVFVFNRQDYYITEKEVLDKGFLVTTD